ncbi:MAG: DEAD/DEAH box helicase [Deltaproteobacteria bacterium]|nr:DEAD/DEAH box helicase [Deltaproteobacteria bacterium]
MISRDLMPTENEKESPHHAQRPDLNKLPEDLSDDEATTDSWEEGPAFKTFTESGLSPKLLVSVRKIGWLTPTPIQSLCLPYSLKGLDVAGFAQTGTGKTGVFLLTAGHMLLESANRKKRAPHQQGRPFVVILAPTRELAIQIQDESQKLLSSLGIESQAIFGGASWEEQAKKLEKDVDIVAATPGRLRDYLEKGVLSLEDVCLFICDEADRMFDMGFVEDVEYFLKKIDRKAQKMVFSATTNQRVNDLVNQYLNEPEYISISPESVTPDRIHQHALICETPQKFKLLLWMLKEHQPKRAIIFTNTKLTALWLHHKLKANSINAGVITGDMPQNKRQRLISDIKEDKTNVLIATDVASRGIHISDVTHVYNFDIPDEAANYIHRIGRTARAGAYGSSYTILCDQYSSNFLAIQDLLGENSPTSTWPDPAFLQVADSSGNPFEEGLNFFPGGDSRNKQDSSPKERRQDRAQGRKDATEERHLDKRERHPDKRERHPDKRERQHRSHSRGGNSDYERSDHGRNRKPNTDRNAPHGHRPNSRGSSHDRPSSSSRHRKQAMAANEKQQQQSTGGLVKRFFSLLFRKREKSD